MSARSPRSIVHDLANVLGVIEGSTELLLADLDRPALRELVEDIRASARGAAAISRHFIDEEAAAASTTVVDDAIDQARGLLRRLAGNHVTLELYLRSPGLAIALDRACVLRTLVNLVVNAREAMPRGGVVRIVTEAATDRDGTRRVVITVTDTGYGIPAEVRARIFDPTFSTKAHGRGLGLATVFALVSAARGSIDVASTPGRGTSFRLGWPAVVPVPLPGHDTATAPTADHMSLLLVDDDDLARRVLRDLLFNVGIDVIAVQDGRAAMAAFDAANPRPAVAVIDLHLATQPGAEVGGALRRQSPDLPLVYISGLERDDPEVRDAIGDDAASRFLGKPFGVRELLDVIRGVVPATMIPSRTR